MKQQKQLAKNPKKVSLKNIKKFLKNYKNFNTYFDEQSIQLVFFKKIKDIKESELILKISNKISDLIYHHPIKITISTTYIEIKINTNDYNDISIQDLRYIYLLNTVLEKI